MVSSVDLILADIERMGILIGKLMGLKLTDNPRLQIEINNGYTDYFDLADGEINLTNPKIITILNSDDKSIAFIKKTNLLIELIELDYELNPTHHHKKKVIIELLKKLNQTDNINYSIERNKKLKYYN